MKQNTSLRLLPVWLLFLIALLFAVNQFAAAQSGDPTKPPTGKPGLSQAGPPVDAVFVEPAVDAVESTSSSAAAPVIDVWYGQSQQFGQIGNPQQWANILGSVSGPAAITSLTYSLNGGATQPLSIGPDNFRLAQRGDFNVEIDISSLANGPNQVQIVALDTQGETTQTTVTLNYTKNQTWPQNYVADWGSASSIQDVAQVVDGKWVIQNGNLRPTVFDYDRLVAIGDMSWRDYEVTVPVTIHGIDEGGFAPPSGGAGVGMILRWQGHYQESNEQPNSGWRNLGGLGWHRWIKNEQNQVVSGLQMIGYSIGFPSGNELAVNPDVQLDFNVPYIYKMSVQTVDGGGDTYRFKVWRASDPEPAIWDMIAQGHPDEPKTGSMLLVAHHVDASFGDVTVRRLASIRPTLNVNVTGSGSVTIDPDQADYAYGQEVTLTANPAAGNTLGRWSGDLSGRQSPVTLSITQDMDITANFVPEQYANLTVNVLGSGTVDLQPDQEEYLVGEEVILTAVPNEGQDFAGWTGGITGLQNPAKLLIQGDTTVNAYFAPKPTYTLNATTIGSGTITREPDKASYYQGEVVKLTATPGVGFQFDGWLGDVTGNENPVYVTMDRNKSVTANFVQGSSHTLNVDVVGNGRVLVEPDKPIYAYGEPVKLTAVPDPGYMLGAWSGDIGGNSSPTTVYMIRDLNITATFVDAINPQSDDFNRCTLNNGRWTTFDPVGDSSFIMTGTQLAISVPAGVNHNLWVDDSFDENNAPRVLTPADNLDFEVEVKFESRVSEQFQLQGILIQQDSDNFLRFDFFHDGSSVRLFAAKFVGGKATPIYNQSIPDGATPHMRVKRVGDQWTQFYSYDGSSWTKGAEFVQGLNVSAAGLFAGNSGDDPPAFTAVADYFFNTAMPIVPEDANPNQITVDINGNGTVERTPNKNSYACGEQVSLRAIPGQDWQFNGWGGDLSGSVNPATIFVEGSYFVIANFTSGSDQPPVFDPISNQTAFPRQLLRFDVRATDPQGTVPTLTAQDLPQGANFKDNGNGTGTFTWTPKVGQIGTHDVTFIASDGTSQSSKTITITVLQARGRIFMPAVLKGS